MAGARARRLVQRLVLRVRRGDRRCEVAIQGERAHLRLGDGAARPRLLRDAEAPHVRAEREDGKAHLELSRRGVLAGRRRRSAPLPRRLHAGLWDGPAMRYAVTGAAGFIGSHLAEALTARGHEVVGLDTGFYREGWLYNGGIKRLPRCISKDIRQISEDDLRGVDAVTGFGGWD